METVQKQEGLNNLVRERIAQKIEKGQQMASRSVATLIEESKIARDFIAPLGVNLKAQEKTPVVTFDANGHVNMLVSNNEYALHENAVGQLGEKFGVPTRYLKNLAQGDEWERQLAARILNDHTNWTDRSRALIRTVGSEVRGVLSDSYRRLNSEQLVTTFLQEVIKQGGILCDGCFDPTKVWLETILPEPIEIPTRKNGMVIVAMGARFSTSDYGDGALELRSFIMQGVCLNGLVRESVMRQVHLGSRLPDNLQLSERTYSLDTKTQASALKDLTANLFSRDLIQQRAMEIQDATEIEVDLGKELKNLAKGKLLKDEVIEVEKVLMKGSIDDGVQGESTLWKLVQGITAHSRNVSPRRGREMQEIAGDLMNRVKL